MESEPVSGSQSNTRRSDHPGDHSRSSPQSQSHGATISTLPREIVLCASRGEPWHETHSSSSSTNLARRPPTTSPSSSTPTRPFGASSTSLRTKFHPPFTVVTPDFDLVGLSERLFCLANALSNHDIYVYNPLTREYREFSDLEGHQRIHTIAFGFEFNETEKDYKMIKIVYPIKNHNRGQVMVCLAHSEVQGCSLRNPTWRRLGNSTHNLEVTPSRPLVNRRLHWTTSKSKYWNVGIVSFDLSDEQFRNVPAPECMHFLTGWCHLVELSGCLFAAVLSEYVMQESWIMDYNIGSYLPRDLHNPNDEFNDRSCQDSRILTRRRFRINARVLAMLRNGEILLEYHNRVLVHYDSNNDKAVNLMLEGLPERFESIVHVSSISRMCDDLLVNM
ncbi:hypothetical protein BT93_J0854 [Corymbia citriodora subsp. variegata]|nr:hypothetical protein BT93_J0854 [Corymbia citriodora subsp. variegata]